MKLKSTKDSIQDGVKVLVYGQSGAGKTKLIETANNPIIISSESGLLSLSGLDLPVYEIKTEQDLDAVYLAVKKSDYDTVCIDSLSDIAETLLDGFLEVNKDGRAAYGLINKVIAKNIRRFRDLKGKNVYFTCKESRTEINSVLFNQPSMPGTSLTNNVPYFFDLVLRLVVNGKGDRTLHTKTNFTQVCKDRSGKLDKTEDANLQAIFDKIILNNLN